ncbi:hypothetical protein P389DRAFT_71007 [Cystobasidium minutum MCA 4210]|uniref:uncharacterized protein n=1 Tax=Cystobasidium minutum MCA 4210 TaxID=1397322 RepID=UPI0034CEF00F|eukprot:jgi/Rhomi1/71007/CE71006_883
MKLEANPDASHLEQRPLSGQLGSNTDPLNHQVLWSQPELSDQPSATNPVRWSASAPAPASPARVASKPFNGPTGTVVPDLDAKKPPRPPNAWILYRSDCIRKQRENRSPDAPKPTQAELSKLFGEQWRNESEDVKAEYERQAEAARDEHSAKYPDWRFSRKPLKAGSAEALSALPKHKATKLQVPSRGGIAKKRRRDNTSGASSEPPSPPDTSTHGSVSPGFSYQSMHLPLGSAPPEYFSRSTYPFPSVLTSASSSQYSFPAISEPSSAPANSSSLPPETYAQYPPQGGLESTLAQRNTSAAQFYNIYEQSPRSGQMDGGRPKTTAAHGPSESHASTFAFNGPASAPQDGSHLGFYVNDHSLQFDPSRISLPNMPFGMAPHEPAGGAPRSANINGGPHWFQDQSSGPSTKTISSVPIDPALATQTIGFEYPDWLFALQDVRVRQDDFSGTPLLDFLNDLRLRAGQRQAETNTFDSASLPYSFP